MPSKCRISGLGKRFGATSVVTDFSLDVADGEFVVILGPSGCGKTTTLRMIAGLTTPDAGSVEIDGRLVSDAARRAFVRPEDRHLGMVFQSYAIWPHMTVLQNVAYPLLVRGMRGAARREKAQAALELVDLGEAAGRSATALSGGQMQRVALARALVSDPALVLFDEPLSNLDLKLRERLREELKSLQRRTRVTGIYVTHDQTEAAELADRIVVMEAGRVVQIGTPEELYRAPRSRFVADFISTANVFPASVEALVGPGAARVVAGAGPSLVVRHEHAVAPGDAVDVMVHPEDCTIGDADDTAAGAHVGRVLRRRFQGTATRYTVSWGATSIDVLDLGTTPRFTEGAEVRLRIGPERARIIPAAGA
ncbi:MAG: ABC transporter ATP-binding protein [Acetobacteraceae bacterium]